MLSERSQTQKDKCCLIPLTEGPWGSQIHRVYAVYKRPTSDLGTHTDWLNGYKNKTHIYAVYKRPTLDLGTHTD